MPDSKYIFDTVSISNFALSESLDLLDARYRGKAFITSEVYNEILDGISGGHGKLAGFANLLESKSFTLLNMREEEYEDYKRHLRNLGGGEASSIAIAYHRKIILVSDDKEARSVARESKIKLTGTIGILKASVMDKQISVHQADSILRKMIDSGFYSPTNSISQIE